MSVLTRSIALALLCCPLFAAAEDAPEPAPPTTASVLAASTAADWRRLDPDYTLVMQLDSGRVVIELAPAFAPEHARNIAQLARQGYFDGLSINRSQDNYVVQWGDPNAGEATARTLGEAKAKLPAEFDRSAQDVGFAALPDPDAYAPQTGYAAGFPAARDPAKDRVWLAHCYGMVGAGRDMAADSSTGNELYVVIGHGPRHLDRNITLVGRVIEGIERLSVLPRGTGPLGFYEQAEQRVPIRSIKLAATLPESERPQLELLRTDTSTFQQLIEARRHRREAWFVDPVGHVELCNVPLPVRAIGATTP